MLSQPQSNAPLSARHALMYAAGVALAALGFCATPALATGATPALCEGQVFSQPFTEFGDTRFYTLAPGGEFNSAAEGWKLSGGAKLTATTRPNGSTGGALSLPAGATATSPPMCVTRQYPIAQVWVNAATGTRKVAVYVSYAGTRSETEPKEVGKLKKGSGVWTLSEFRLQPKLAGSEEAPHNVTFTFQAAAGTGETQLYDLYIDPRMR